MYQKELIKKKKDSDYALYLLERSVDKAFERGQPHYKKKPYENVDCGWSTRKRMFEDLKNDNNFIKKWREQTSIYERTKNDYDRPSIGRIDHSKGYYHNNIECQPMFINKNSNPGVVVLTQNNILVYHDDFRSISQLGRKLSESNIPINTLNIKAEQFNIIGNGLQIYVRLRKKTKQFQLSDNPFLKCVLEFKTQKYDLCTGIIVREKVHGQVIIPNAKIGFINNSRY
ncbi:hypothetical protein [Metabacillus litoralis]|uniref:hypothetical protein n=1 Tax=Metabacillus litoralis TaxID=152268 RepID=UPI0013CE6872|nr:hypothetical protein [Metabacillus litoralis]